MLLKIRAGQFLRETGTLILYRLQIQGTDKGQVKGISLSATIFARAVKRFNVLLISVSLLLSVLVVCRIPEVLEH